MSNAYVSLTYSSSKFNVLTSSWNYIKYKNRQPWIKFQGYTFFVIYNFKTNYLLKTNINTFDDFKVFTNYYFSKLYPYFEKENI